MLCCAVCQGHYGDAVALINRSEMVMCQGEALPIDLRVRRGETNRHRPDAACAGAPSGAAAAPVATSEANITIADQICLHVAAHLYKVTVAVISRAELFAVCRAAYPNQNGYSTECCTCVPVCVQVCVWRTCVS
jgi:hypothetical protein